MKIVVMMGLILCTHIFTAQASEGALEADAAYRQMLREDLVLESRSKKNFPRRSTSQYTRNPGDYFVIGEGGPFELEPTGVSAGSVVGA